MERSTMLLRVLGRLKQQLRTVSAASASSRELAFTPKFELGPPIPVRYHVSSVDPCEGGAPVRVQGRFISNGDFSSGGVGGRRWIHAGPASAAEEGLESGVQEGAIAEGSQQVAVKRVVENEGGVSESEQGSGGGRLESFQGGLHAVGQLEEAQAAVTGRSLKEVNQLLSQCVARGDYAQAQRIFDAWSAVPGNAPSVLTYNFLLHAMARSGARHETLLSVVAAMEARDLQPNMLTFNSLLRAAFRDRDAPRAENILARMEESGPQAAPDADAYNLVVALCALERRVGSALTRMQSMLRRGFLPSKSAYNEVLMACARTRRSRDAIAVLKELEAQSMTPVPGTLGELLSASTEAEDHECCLLVLQMTARRKLLLDQGGLLLALNLAARSGSAPLAEQAWALLGGVLQGRKALPAFHLARIHAYSAASDFTSAFRCVRELEEEGAPAPALCPLSSLRPLTRALSQGVGVLDTAYFQLADMHAGGELVARAALNCVVAGCSSVRDTERAQQTFDEMERTFELPPDVHSFNALMDGYSKTRQAKRAEELFAELQQRGLEPTAQTYELLASAFIAAMDAPKALQTLEAMAKAGHAASRDVLIHLFRRSKRAAFQPGVDYAAALISSIGYRSASAGEVRRRNLLMEVAGASMDPRPARRERGPPGGRERWDHPEAQQQQLAQGKGW